MSEWRSWHVHYGDLDRLVLECVHPALERVEARVERRFWERHYAGGTHLRVRLRGQGAALRGAGAEVEAAARAFVAAHPLPDRPYSAERAAALLVREGEPVEAEELVYRNNVVVPRPYVIHPGAYVSPQAAELAQDFRHDALPLAVRIIAGRRPRREEMLRLYFLQALVTTAGDVAGGAVSYKSHWEGLSAGAPPQVGERIRAGYRENHDAVAALLGEVLDAWERDRGAGDPVLSGWKALLDRYAGRTRALLAAGVQVTPQPGTLEDARALREIAWTPGQEQSRFVRTLWADERFMASLQFEPSFLVPRVLVNLLYVLVNTVGLTPIDKMMLCHHAHAAVEDHSGRSLDEILERNVAAIVAAHAHRWA